MATIKKREQHPLNSMHTSGIFSDMSIDGPEIGTLVLIVDKAKNLPNRKTIGKQDPYCAARLGKEAKKTATDVRGGQTPKWDQELRFTVHDCPDYYQLKVSVFNDDKKTDLIGETWIDLRDIVVIGGGQSDTWHTLNFRSKYAGEIRLEITYYDARPKPEKPVAKPKTVASNTEANNAAVQPAAAPKRRPLPSEPPNGPAQPVQPQQQQQQQQQTQVPQPEHVQTPPRKQPGTPSSFVPNQSPLQTLEYSTPSPSSRPLPKSHHNSPAPVAGPGYSTPPQHQLHAHRYSDKYVVRADEPDLGVLDDRSQYSAAYSQAHTQNQYHGCDRQGSQASFEPERDHYDPRAVPQTDDDDRPPPPPVHRSRGSSSAAVSGPMDLAIRPGSFDGSLRGAPPTMRQDVLRSAAHRQSVGAAAYPGRPTYRPYDSAPAAAAAVPQYTDEGAHHTPSPPRQRSFDTAHDSHQRSMQPTVEDDPESPNAVVQSYRKSISRQSLSSAQYAAPEYDTAAAPAPLSLSGRNSGIGYGSQSPAIPSSHHPQHHHQQQQQQQNGRRQSNHQEVGPIVPRNINYATSPELYQSRDGYGASASPRNSRQRSPSPNPMVDHYHVSPGPSPHREQHPPSPIPGRKPSEDPYQTTTVPISHTSHTDSHIHYRHDPREDQRLVSRSPGFAAPPDVPASLVPGADPSLALELSSRINEGRRQEGRRNSAMAAPTRGRQMLEYCQDGTPPSQHFGSSIPQHHRSFDNGHLPNFYTNERSSTVLTKPRSLSPLPTQNHAIRRKSVSPAPPQVDSGRLISGVPFAPDSFDELNPTVAAAKAETKRVNPDFNEATGKIISHDGKEIDPSDHLPMETWAPEPEPFEERNKKKLQGGPSANGLTIGASGRRQLIIAAARPQGSSPVTYSGGNSGSPSSFSTYGGSSPTAAANSAAAARNRLQKKTHTRGMSDVASFGTSAPGHNPLAPIKPPYHQDNHMLPRTLQRASTFDHFQQNENQNHAPLVLYQGGGRNSMDYHQGAGGGRPPPPIPAKIPMSGGGSPNPYRGGDMDPGLPVMSGALPAPGPPVPWGGRHGHDSRVGSEQWALMEEMSRIDIGTGRSRRHGSGY